MATAQPDNYGLRPGGGQGSGSGGVAQTTNGTTSSNSSQGSNSNTVSSGTSSSNTNSTTNSSGTSSSNTNTSNNSTTQGGYTGSESYTKSGSSSTTNMSSAALKALNDLIAQLSGGGTASTKAQADQIKEQLAVLLQKQGDYSKEVAFADAEGAVRMLLRQNMEKLLPQIDNAAQGAGTSQSAMRALLLQRAAENSADLASSKQLEAAVQYGNIGNGVAGSITNLLQLGDPTTNMLLNALNISKGAVSSTSTSESGTKSTSGTTSSVTNGTSNSNTTGTSTNQSTTNQATTGTTTGNQSTASSGFNNSSGSNSSTTTSAPIGGTGGSGGSSGSNGGMMFVGPTTTTNEQNAINKLLVELSGGTSYGFGSGIDF